ncbi:MAG: 2,3-bisphosphoglycerate-independent phosphoglycerate mutase [Promethearchaeota archaeon]
MKKSAIIIVLDGAADRPAVALDGKTPLEVANTPNMDILVTEGACGMMDVLSPGVPPGSDTAQMMLLGYDPYKYYNGRGALEAIGGGIDVQPGDICFRANFASVVENEDGKLIVVDRRAGRDIPEIQEIISILNTYQPPFDDVRVKLIHTTQHRGALILKGKNLALDHHDPDPHEPGHPLHEFIPNPDNPGAIRTVKIINDFQRFIHNKLKEHPINKKRLENNKPPVNMVLFRGGSIKPALPNFHDKFGIHGAFVCGNALIAGVCLSIGLSPALTVDDLNFQRKISAAFNALEDYQFLFFHVKEPDNLSHDKKPLEKVKILEKIDEQLIGKFLELDPENNIICLTIDHATPSSIGEHCGDPVPIALWGFGVRADPICAFNERTCADGALNKIKGRDLMPIILDKLNKRKKFRP